MMSIPGLVFAQSGGVQGSAPSAIQGTVEDGSGSAVTGAIVTLETSASTANVQRSQTKPGLSAFPPQTREITRSRSPHLDSPFGQ
jgi:hypothetical protein